MSSPRTFLLLAVLSFGISACTSGRNQQLTELQTELRAERELLKNTRTEMRTLIDELKPMLAFSKILQEGNLMGLLGRGDDATSGKNEGAESKMADGAEDTEIRISISLLDSLRADPATAARGARVVPSIKDGKPNGLKLYAVRPSSVFATLGIHNGDTIQSINGFSLASPDEAIEAYSKVKDATTWVITLIRRGRPLTLTIHAE